MNIHTTTDPAVYRKALAELARNRYVVIEPSGRIVDTSVLQDGDTLLAEQVPDGIAVCDVCGFAIETAVHIDDFEPVHTFIDEDAEYFLTEAESPKVGF